MIPVAYLRRSSPDTRNGRGDVSKEQQTEAVQRLAAEDGHQPDALLILEGDWGKSGRDAKIADRKDWAKLLGMVERDEVSHVYALEMDRLGRSVMQTAKLATLARDHRVIIRCAVGVSPDYSTPEGEMMTNTLANIHQYYGSKAAERAKANIATRRARGDYLGVPPYGSVIKDGKLVPNPAERVADVIDAYQRAGSYLGAAKLLTAAKVPSRHGQHWSEQTVYRILAREGVTLPARGEGVAARRRREWRLHRLLRCACGGTLIAQARHADRVTVYFCGRGRRDPTHPRPYAISERKIIGWIMAEAARLQVPADVVEVGDPSADRAALEQRREDVGWAVANRAMSRDTATQEISRIEAEITALGDAETVATVPQSIDWERWDAASINEILRTYWRHVELDEQMHPLRAEWRIPAEYLRP